jgi:hypothetical protein
MLMPASWRPLRALFRTHRVPTAVRGRFGFSQASDSNFDPASLRGKFAAVANQIDDYLKNSVLVTPQAHVFQPPRSLRSQWRKLSPSILKILEVRLSTNKLDTKRNIAFHHLLVEDGLHLCLDIYEAELLFFQTYLLSDLIFAEQEKVVEQME